MFNRLMFFILKKWGSKLRFSVCIGCNFIGDDVNVELTDKFIFEENTFHSKKQKWHVAQKVSKGKIK